MNNLIDFLDDIKFNTHRFFSDIERWIAFRTYDRYDIVKTDLSPNYWDLDTRMLHANFSLLVQYVEIEKGTLQYYVNKDNKLKFNWLSRRMRFGHIPKEERRLLGLQYLDWEILNDEENFPDSQRNGAKEIKKLYLWWVDIRSRRIDPYDRYEKELDALPSTHDLLVGTKITLTTDQRNQMMDVYNKIDALEGKYDKEDEHQLMRLIRIRRQLWS